MGSYDVAVIGAGHNGLVTAAYLAKSGARVVVLEARPFVGGACVTEEPWPGFRINTYAYLAGMLRPEIVSDLNLRKFGYETLPLDPEAFHPFPDGRSLSLWMDEARTLREIAKFSPEDAAAYPRYTEFWNGVLDLLEPFMLAPPSSFSELASSFSDPDTEVLLRDLFLRSARDLLDDWFESEEVKVSLGFSATVGAFVGPRTPGTAYVLAHNGIANLDGRRGAWGFVKGGMGRITDALAAAARAHGAEIRTSARVHRIRVQSGKATGVELADGSLVEARAVAASVDAQQTLLHLVPEDSIERSILREAKKIRSNATTVKFNAALDHLPTFRSAPTTPGPHHGGSIALASSLDALERAYDQAKFGNLSDPPFMEILFQSAVDPTVAPAGKHTMTCSVKYAPRHLSTGSWREFAPQAAEITLATIEEYAPDIRSAILHAQVVTPEQIESDLGLTGGSCFQGDMTPDQMFGFRPFPGFAHYRLPVDGLYLCGSAAHPGGAVSGAPGHNAAQVILRDLKVGRS
jgi:phytoene dehydrogenase-like protein